MFALWIFHDVSARGTSGSPACFVNGLFRSENREKRRQKAKNRAHMRHGDPIEKPHAALILSEYA